MSTPALVNVTMSSSLGQSRGESIVYFDQPSLWVLGQVATRTSAGLQTVSTVYDGATALPAASYRFGKLQAAYAFHPDGSLAGITNGLNHRTSFSDYKRGLPQRIDYPDGTATTGTVDNIGVLTSITNEAGATWAYGYDAMGRLASKTPPGGDPVEYNATTLSFVQVAQDEYGLGPGHWRQTITTGNAITAHYFDARWRKRVTVTHDAADPGTQRMQRFDYDPYNRTTFVAYPTRSNGSITQPTPGTATVYDALGRPVSSVADSELGPLSTTTLYLDNFLKQVTNPRGYATTTQYQVFDEPSEANLTGISAPEDESTRIERDTFGKPLAIIRSGGSSSGFLSATRSYVYDAYQQLCKTIDPETGATIQALDAADNLSWRAVGLDLTSTATCDLDQVPAEKVIAHTYDARDRLTGTGFGDGSPSIGRSYTADGLLATVVSNGTTRFNDYNQRRLLLRESLSPGDGWHLLHDYDANGHERQLIYPHDVSVAYAPNALGEATRVGEFATGVTYHPNGAVAGYTLGNGIVHTLTQNTRGLPASNNDSGVMQDRYDHDANGNVAAITDLQEGIGTRSMGYDGLDRLTAANAPGVWGNATYSYDALDNLRNSVVGGRSVQPDYDERNRLSRVNINGEYIGYAYDSQGNIIARGAQGYYFDQANRLQMVNDKANYVYDGLGLRFAAVIPGGNINYTFYSQAGQLMYAERQPNTQAATHFYYLAGKLIAESGVTGTFYAHTDALGSPVARTDASGAIVSRTRYEPYGGIAAGAVPTGIGFTGHLNDADTGLVYMQQRYYDPIAGRFMSVDPSSLDAGPADGFGRYTYVDNNPYAKVDPDGRIANFVFGAIVGGGIELGYQLANSGSIIDWKAVGVAAGAGALTGGIGGIAATLATKGAISATQAIAATAATGGLAAATGKSVEAGLKGESVTPGEVAISVAAGALGSAVGGKLATKMIGAAEATAASGDNIVSGIGKNTLGAIRQGGSTSSVTIGTSEVTQKMADVATGISAKKLEEATK